MLSIQDYSVCCCYPGVFPPFRGGINFVSDEMVEMRYQYKEEFVEEFGRTNVVIAAYTTAQARLKLYSYLEQLGPVPYTPILYVLY
jgi:hypothetical protein